jgi:hypothetical protein
MVMAMTTFNESQHQTEEAPRQWFEFRARDTLRMTCILPFGSSYRLTIAVNISSLLKLDKAADRCLVWSGTVSDGWGGA